MSKNYLSFSFKKSEISVLNAAIILLKNTGKQGWWFLLKPADAFPNYSDISVKYAAIYGKKKGF